MTDATKHNPKTWAWSPQGAGSSAASGRSSCAACTSSRLRCPGCTWNRPIRVRRTVRIRVPVQQGLCRRGGWPAPAAVPRLASSI